MRKQINRLVDVLKNKKVQWKQNKQTNKQTEQKVNIQTCASHGSILTDIVCREAWQTLDMPESSRFTKLSNWHQFWYRLWRQILHWNSLTSNRDRYEQYGPGCRHWKQQNSGRLKMKQQEFNKRQTACQVSPNLKPWFCSPEKSKYVVTWSKSKQLNPNW